MPTLFVYVHYVSKCPVFAQETMTLNETVIKVTDVKIRSSGANITTQTPFTLTESAVPNVNIRHEQV